MFDPDRIDDTCVALAAAREPDPGTDARQDANRKKLKDCDARLATYRAALEAGTDPALVGKWIAEVQAERSSAERALDQATQGQRLTKEEVRGLVAALGDTVSALRRADPVDKADAYRELGISLTFHPEGCPGRGPTPRVLRSGVGGGTPTRLAGIRPCPPGGEQGRTSWMTWRPSCPTSSAWMVHPSPCTSTSPRRPPCRLTEW